MKKKIVRVGSNSFRGEVLLFFSSPLPSNQVKEAPRKSLTVFGGGCKLGKWHLTPELGVCWATETNLLALSKTGVEWGRQFLEGLAMHSESLRVYVNKETGSWLLPGEFSSWESEWSGLWQQAMGGGQWEADGIFRFWFDKKTWVLYFKRYLDSR